MTSNKALLFILILNFTYLSLKWIFSFYFFDENLIISVLSNTKDIQYYPLIKSLSEFDLNPTFLDYYNNTNIINFPLASLIIHSIFFKLINIYSFIILEFILHLLLIFILFNIIKKIFDSSNVALAFSLIIFTVILLLKLGGHFINLEYLQKLYFILNENLGIRTPRPLVTGVFYFVFIYYILFFQKRINNQLSYIYIIKIALPLGLLANSFIFLFFNCLIFLFLFTAVSIDQKFSIWFKTNKKFIIFFIILLSFFLLPFAVQMFFGEKDYSGRLGLIVINLEQKFFLVKYYLSSLLRAEFLILFITTVFFHFYLNKKNKKNSIVDKINVFFFITLSSIFSPLLFFIFSPNIISIFHFLNLMIFSFVFYILLAFFGCINLILKDLDKSKKYLINIYFTSFVVILLILSIPIEAKFFLKDKQKRIELNQIDDFFNNNNLNNTNLKLFTNDLLIMNLWILNGNKQLVISDSFSNSLTDNQIEFNLMNALKDFEIGEIQLKKLISFENSQIRNKLFMFLFNYKYQANSLYTFSKLKNYNKDNQQIITQTSPFRVQMQIVPNDEKQRLLRLFDNLKVNQNLLPEYVVINNSGLFKDFKIKNNQYIILLNTKNYQILKRS